MTMRRPAIIGLLVWSGLVGFSLVHTPRTVASDIDPSTGNPTRNYEPGPAAEQCGDTPNSTACLSAAWVTNIDAARTGEGVGPITLPLDFEGLSAPEQLLTLANLERVDRGLDAIAGLSPQLDADAERGAAAANDPDGPDGFSWGSNWASSSFSLYNDFSWMYDDGPGSFNLDCGSAEASGCWGHRDNILRDYAEPVGMGAGAQGSSQTQLFVSAYTPAAVGGADAPITPFWSSIAQTLPVGIAPNPIVLANSATSDSVTVWASGEPMDITAAIDDGWSITPTECNLAPGSSCQMTLAAPVGQAPATTTLKLNGPNGAQSIGVSRHIAVHLTARLARSSIHVHQIDVLNGEIVPAAPGQHVALELRRDGRWHAVATTTLDTRSNFNYSIRPNAAGVRHYRLFEAAADGYEAAASGSLALQVTRRTRQRPVPPLPLLQLTAEIKHPLANPLARE
jgi:hypothetical protein